MHLNEQTQYEVQDALMVRETMVQADVASKKARLYAQMASDPAVRQLFETSAAVNAKVAQDLKGFLPDFV